jgi:hypothetical protein
VLNRGPEAPPHQVPGWLFMASLRRIAHPRISESSNPFSFAVVSLSIFGPTRTAEAASLVAHIPFSFFVGDIRFDAGPYLIEPSATARVFEIRLANCDSPKAAVQAISIPEQNDSLSRKLLFYCRGNGYFLAQVLVAHGEPVTQWPQSQPARLLVPPP